MKIDVVVAFCFLLFFLSVFCQSATTSTTTTTAPAAISSTPSTTTPPPRSPQMPLPQPPTTTTLLFAYTHTPRPPPPLPSPPHHLIITTITDLRRRPPSPGPSPSAPSSGLVVVRVLVHVLRLDLRLGPRLRLVAAWCGWMRVRVFRGGLVLVRRFVGGGACCMRRSHYTHTHTHTPNNINIHGGAWHVLGLPAVARRDPGHLELEGLVLGLVVELVQAGLGRGG